jgi:hypothetical protein
VVSVWSLLALYLVSIGSLFGLYWVTFLLGLYGFHRARFGARASLAPLASLVWVFIGSVLGHFLISIGSFIRSVFGLDLVFIWSVLGLYLVSIGSFIRSVFGLYWVFIWSVLGLYLVCIGFLFGLYWVTFFYIWET